MRIIPALLIYALLGLTAFTIAKANEIPPSCASLLQGTTPHSVAFVKLINEAFNLGLLEISDLEAIKGHEHPISPLKRVSSVQALQLKEGFDLLLSDTRKLDWPGIQKEVLALMQKKNISTDREFIARNETRKKFNPHVSSSFAVPWLYSSSQAIFVAREGKGFIAIAIQDSQVYIIDLEEILHPIRVPIADVYKFTPTYFVAKDGRELIVVRALDKHLYIIDLRDPLQPIKVPTEGPIDTSPSYFVSKDGKEHIAFGSKDKHLHILDLANPHQSIKVPTRAQITSRPTYFVAKDGRELLAVGSHDNNLYIIDLANPLQPIKVPIKSVVDSSPTYYLTNDDREILAVVSWNNYLHLIDLFENPPSKELE